MVLFPIDGQYYCHLALWSYLCRNYGIINHRAETCHRLRRPKPHILDQVCEKEVTQQKFTLINETVLHIRRG